MSAPKTAQSRSKGSDPWNGEVVLERREEIGRWQLGGGPEPVLNSIFTSAASYMGENLVTEMPMRLMFELPGHRFEIMAVPSSWPEPTRTVVGTADEEDY